MSKLRIQQYMDKHRLTPLFEDLMNKVLHEQPDDPVIYLINCLYRKAALPVPKDLKANALRKSSPERAGRRTKSPEKSSTQAWAVGSGPDLVDRSYDKPWLKHSRKTKLKDDDKMEPRQGRKQKSGWVSDTKVTATTFDELFEEDCHHKMENTAQRHQQEDNTDIQKAWARHISLHDSEDPNYRSKGYSGPRCQRNQDDPLAGEIMLAKEEQTTESSESSSKTKSMGAKLEAAKHRQDLEKLLQESDKASVDSGFYGDRNIDEEDDAIELLEDPDDLIREGVTNIPKSGYKLSRVLRQRKEEANVKLNINMAVSSENIFLLVILHLGDFLEVHSGTITNLMLRGLTQGCHFGQTDFLNYLLMCRTMILRVFHKLWDQESQCGVFQILMVNPLKLTPIKKGDRPDLVPLPL